MADHKARNDAQVVQQVTELTPTATNNAIYDLLMNTKVSQSFPATGATSASEIVNGLTPLLVEDAAEIPEFAEVTWTEDDTKIIATGPDTGKPFTVADGPGNGTWASITTTANTPKSPNHWIAENFDSGALPASTDTVFITGLNADQGFLYGLNQSGVALAAMHVKADSKAPIGLLPYDTSGSLGSYYQLDYRDCFLVIEITALYIGDGTGEHSQRIFIDLEATACNCTIYNTASQGDNPQDNEAAPVHILGGDNTSTLLIMDGKLDLAMLVGSVGQWLSLIAAGGSRVRCGSGCTLVTVESTGNASIETRGAVTTYRTRGSGTLLHYAGNVLTMDLQGGNGEVRATAALTIGTLNGYPGKQLDLSRCDAVVTVTNMTSYGTPDSPFTILDPLNKLEMTNPASTPNGAQSLVVISGSGRNVRVT